MSGCPSHTKHHAPGARLRGARTSDLAQYAISATFWLGVALALVGIGYAIGTALESALLGFLGADFIFLIVMSVFTSRQGRAAQDRR